jgi:hypothetical protein
VTHKGKYYQTEDTVLQPKPLRTPRPTIYAGDESDAAKNLIAQTMRCIRYAWRSPEYVATKIANMKESRERLGLLPMQFGVSAYFFVRKLDNLQQVLLGKSLPAFSGHSEIIGLYIWMVECVCSSNFCIRRISSLLRVTVDFPAVPSRREQSFHRRPQTFLRLFPAHRSQ